MMSSFSLNKNSTKTTVGNGSLGSRVDEERSELRKLMRSASIVNHRVLERTLHLFLSGKRSTWVSIDFSSFPPPFFFALFSWTKQNAVAVWEVMNFSCVCVLDVHVRV